MKKQSESYEKLRIDTHRDLRKNIRTISQRFNDNPELARLLMVNPIFAFEDAGVELSAELRRHITNRMRFPPRLIERKAKLEEELREEFRKVDTAIELPLTDIKRAHLFFDLLKLPRKEEHGGDRLLPRQARAYRKDHPLVSKLVEYERVSQGALVFYPRAVYDAYKRGERRHKWLRAIRFKV